MSAIKEQIREDIMNFVNGKKFVPCNKEELVSHFASYYEKDDVVETVNYMLERYDLVTTAKKNIQSARQSMIFTGVVTGVNDDYIYVKTEGFDDDCRISRKPYEIIFPKSEVVFKSFDFAGSDGELIKVNKASSPTLVGEIQVEGYHSGKYEYYIKPQTKRIGYKLHLDKSQCKDLVDGHKVIYKLDADKKGIKASIDKVIGHKTDVGVDITSLAIEAEVPIEFSKEALEQAEKTPNEVRKEDKVNRVDYTGKEHLVITIDGADTKDRDDAFEIVKDGEILHVKVHIADVAHYVPVGSPIWNDALERGTSCYLADRVIPMLPRKLSNGICSLDPNVERLAMSYEFDIDERGEVSNFVVNPSVIKSSKAFTYDEVQAIIEGNPEVMSNNKEYLELIDLAVEASKRLSARKEKNGELKLDTREAKVIVDENGHAIDVKVRVQRESERLIEDLMVATNEAGARFVYNMGVPFLYRNHDEPNEEKLDINFIPLCKSLKLTPRFRNGNLSYEYRRLMSSVEDDTVKAALSDAFLRCMAKAVYGAEETGHFGLGLDYYSQLTSPIRRLPDLIDEHMLHMICRLKDEPELYEKMLGMHDKMVELGYSTSSQERRADQLERDVTKMKFAEYMESHVGEEYKGIISGFSKNGIFVQLPNTVEGMIPFKYINHDAFTYDDSRKMAIGKRSGETFIIGTPLMVNVKKASKADSQIDFGYIKRLDKSNGNNDSKKGQAKRR